MMSGTLDPTEMYSDILGFSKDTIQKSFESPFPEENRLNLIIPKTTTKYDMRSEQQYRDIAQVLNEVCDRVPGNCAVFLPSYSLLESVNKYFQFESKKNVLKELPGMTKQEKHELLENFKKCKKNTVLLGAATGSFGEGIDIEDNILKAVIVVGLPLGMPDLETKELISYYDDKFGKGQDYGYFLPAFIKTLQNAGRCIRSEKDRGIIVFLDQRFTWSNYFRFFPADWKLKISLDYKEVIADFFDK